MEKVTDRLRGFVRVGIEGAYPERFINICAQNRIAFWGVRPLGECQMEATLPRKDYSRAKRLAQQAGCTLTAQKKQGLPFFLLRFRYRYALMAGIVLCFVLLLISAQYVWAFSVEGNEALSQEEILTALREIGVDVGMPVRQVDIIEIRNKMLLRMDRLSWITVNVVGSHATVIVRERREKPDIIPKNSPANILAAKSGLIVRMDTLAGSPKVFPGQMVSEGDLLVSGLMDSAQQGVRLIQARADVTARTWTEIESVIPTMAAGKHYTGRIQRRSYLIIGKKRMNFFAGTSQPFAYCDKIAATSQLTIPPGITLPVTLITETYTEYTPTDYQMDAAVAEGVLGQAMEESLERSTAGGEITSQNLTFQAEEGLVRGRLEAECLEKIARVVEIPMGNGD